MPFTEFCCRSGGSNLNAGTRTGNSTQPGTSADFTYASGDWVQSTGVFTVASGDPASDGVAVGDFASVYADGSSVTGFVGRVTARDSTTITVSITIKSGTAPTDGTGNRTLKIGGAWLGPNGTSGFPFNFAQNTMVASSGDFPRINMKNDATYSVSAAVTHGNSDITFQGYTTSYGDLGRAILDGGTSGSAYKLLTVSGGSCTLIDLIFDHNGSSGTADLLDVAAGGVWVRRCVCRNSRRHGFYSIAGQSGVTFEECEAHDCNVGFSNNAGGTWIRCVSHNNSGNGFENNGSNTPQTYINCIADSNGADGFMIFGIVNYCIQCDAYGNAAHGFSVEGTSNRVWLNYFENCTAVKNGGYGFSQPVNRRGMIRNCGVGAGTEANTSGGIQSAYMEESGNVTYTSNTTPWVDPADGDFSLSDGSEAANAGRATFTQTAASYGPTTGYAAIGAAGAEAGGGGGGAFPVIGVNSPVIRGVL